METVLKSVLNCYGTEIDFVIKKILSDDYKELFSTQEKEIYSYIQNVVKSTGKSPSEEYFLSEFPEYTVPLSKAQKLSVDDLKTHFALVVQKRNNQEVSRILMQASRDVVDNGFTLEVADKLQALRITDAGQEDNDVVSSEESFKEFYGKKKEQPTGLLTFVKDVDDRIGGLPMGGMSVLFGYTAQGKSLLANNIAYNNAKKLKYNILIVSLEVSKEDCMINLLSRHSFESKFDKYPCIKATKIRQCMLSEEEEDYLMNVVVPDFYSEGGSIAILDETDFETFSFAEIADKLEKEDDKMIAKTGYGVDAVIWDHANLFKFNGSGRKFSSENSEINAYVSWIRKKSITFRRIRGTSEYRKVHMMVLAQANREGYKRACKGKGFYDLRAIAEANELERGAQQIFSIWTSEDLKLAKEATMQILKNRTGQILQDPCSIFFDPENYVAGAEVEGFNDMINTDELGDIFGDSSSIIDSF